MNTIFTKFSKLTGFFVSLCALFAIQGSLYGQTVLSTDPALTNSNSYGTVTFNFENTNAFPVVITDISGIVSGYGTQAVDLWFKTSPVNGAPGIINTSNGWIAGGSGSVYGVANTTTTATQPLLSGLSISVPANTTYGFALSVQSAAIGTLRGSSFASTLVSSAGGCNIIMSPTASFSDPLPIPVAPSTPSSGWIGSIRFVNGTPCNTMPVAATVSGPTSVCAGATFSLTSSAIAGLPGVSYQWQFYSTITNTWQDISGATSPTLTMVGGITSTTELRLRTECTATAQASISSVHTVNIATTFAAGVYTINKNAPSTQTNFISFSDAAAALKCGVNGAVTFNVVPGSGPYSDQVVFPKVPGTSQTNRIRLNGNGEVLQGVAVPGVIILLDGTSYLTIDSLTIRSVSTSGPTYGVALRDTCYYDSIQNCFLDMRSLENPAGVTTSAGISLSNFFGVTGTSPASTMMCYVGQNHILGSYGSVNATYGVVSGFNTGLATNWLADSGNVIAHNEIENFTYGVYNYGSRDIKILYNNIHAKNKASTISFYGIICWTGWWNAYIASQQDRVEIVGNRVHSPAASGTTTVGFWGISAGNNYSGNNNLGSKITIANNVIYNVQNVGLGSAAIYGINVYNSGSVNNTNDTCIVAHNTIDFSFPLNGSGSMYGILYNYYYQNAVQERLLVYNNLVTITGGTTGLKYGFFQNDLSMPAGTFFAGRNNFYVNSNQPGMQYYGRYAGTNYNTMADFQAAHPTLEQGSLSVDPQYVNPALGDFTPMNYTLMGNGVDLMNIVPTDILGRPRSATPTPGAFEIATDAGVEALVAPLGTYCSSVKEVKVNIKNNGVTTINTVDVHWSLNGVLQTPVSYTGNLIPQSSAVVTLGNGLFLPNTPVTIKAWTNLPNGFADPFNYNDTLVVTTQSSTSVPVDLGPDVAICTGASHTLNAGYPGSIFLWDNNSNQQTRTVNQAGTYYVRVTALDGCIGVDTVKLSLHPLPVVDLGPDFAICWGSPTILDAGHPGASYNWDDGSNNQTRTVDTAGTYYVEVTDTHGCMGSDEIVLILKDLPSVSGINATHSDSGLYTFYPLNPQYSSSYRWNFGDGSPEVWGYTVQHAYSTPGIYTVTLYLEGECTGLIIDKTRTVDVFVVPGGGTGIRELPADGSIVVYPNPARDWVSVESDANALQHVMLYNVLGQAVYQSSAQNARLHRVPVSKLAAGLYTVQIQTSSGTFFAKLVLSR